MALWDKLLRRAEHDLEHAKATKARLERESTALDATGRSLRKAIAEARGQDAATVLFFGEGITRTQEAVEMNEGKQRVAIQALRQSAVAQKRAERMVEIHRIRERDRRNRRNRLEADDLAQASWRRRKDESS